MHQIFFRDCSSFQKGLGPVVRTWNRCVCLLTRFIFFGIGCRFRQSVRKLGCRRCERTAMLFYPKTLRKDTDLMSRNQILTLNSIGRILCSSTHFVYWTWWPWQSTGTFCKPICTPLFRAHPTEPFGKRVEFYVYFKIHNLWQIRFLDCFSSMRSYVVGSPSFGPASNHRSTNISFSMVLYWK